MMMFALMPRPSSASERIVSEWNPGPMRRAWHARMAARSRLNRAVVPFLPPTRREHEWRDVKLVFTIAPFLPANHERTSVGTTARERA